MTPHLQNWSGTYTFTAPRLNRPGSIDELRRIVAGARRTRALGSGHSFNGIADTEGELLDLSGLPDAFDVDRHRGVVTVGAAMQYGDLAGRLHRHGLALHNMGSLPSITVAGATATGTHGSGDRNGNLATAVAGLELVDAEGNLLIVDRGDAGFDGMVVGLGAFGIVTRVTLDVQPTFDVRQDAFAGLPWRTLFDRLGEVMSGAYSVSLFTKWASPQVDRLWLKSRLDDDRALADAAEHLGAESANHTMIYGEDDPASRRNPFGVAGPWSERLTHFRSDRDAGSPEQIQSEILVPRDRAVEALEILRAMGDRIDPHLGTSELRTVAADTLWLSASYGHDVVGIHFTWNKEPEAVGRLTAEIEEKLLPLGGRPHWGKMIHAPAERLATLYPRMEEFRALARRADPGGKFRNAFLDRHVFGTR